MCLILRVRFFHWWLGVLLVVERRSGQLALLIWDEACGRRDAHLFGLLLSCS